MIFANSDPDLIGCEVEPVIILFFPFFQSGNFGDLIDLKSGTIKNGSRDESYLQNKILFTFDNEMRIWRIMRCSQIPWTFTLVEKPKNYRSEARLWLMAARRIKHRFIWTPKPQKGIPMDDFACLKSYGNIKNYGRYTYVNF